jgi:hypothetical protein
MMDPDKFARFLSIVSARCSSADQTGRAYYGNCLNQYTEHMKPFFEHGHFLGQPVVVDTSGFRRLRQQHNHPKVPEEDDENNEVIRRELLNFSFFLALKPISNYYYYY